MPCYSAIVKKLVTVSPDDKVESVIAVLRKNKISAVPVVDEKGALLGLFSMKILLRNLIPVSIAMSNGVQMDIKVSAAPGVAKRLAKVKPLSVGEVMERKYPSVSPDAQIWEGVSLLTTQGGPLPVVDDKGKFIGMITYDSIVETAVLSGLAECHSEQSEESRHYRTKDPSPSAQDDASYIEISIVLADDAFVQDLNKRYRHKDKPTNVLSFPQTEIEDLDASQPFLSLGDIIIAYETIVREAGEQGKPLADHFRHMLVHGCLHLLHFDHIEEDEAQAMESLEIAILGSFGVKNPYQDAL